MGQERSAKYLDRRGHLGNLGLYAKNRGSYRRRHDTRKQGALIYPCTRSLWARGGWSEDRERAGRKTGIKDGSQRQTGGESARPSDESDVGCRDRVMVA